MNTQDGGFLSPGAAQLVSLKLDGIQWNDLGDPERVMCTLAENGLEMPAWARLAMQNANRMRSLGPPLPAEALPIGRFGETGRCGWNAACTLQVDDLAEYIASPQQK